MQLPAPSGKTPVPDGLPEGISNAYWFQVFNSASFSLVLGMPMMLFFKHLGASATVLGIVQGLPALLNILQIPSARFVEQVGYRRFVLRGWSLRSVFILGLAGVALLPASVDSLTRVALALFILFCYNFSRGISVCGWLPWITQLIPEHVRGRYVSMDQTFGIGAIVVSSTLTGLFLRGDTGLGAFAVVFFLSFLAAVASLYYLKRIPDVPVAEEVRSRSSEPVPWKAIWSYRPFQRIVLFNCVVLAGWAGGGVVSVPFLRDMFAVKDSTFMYLTAIWGCFYMVGVYFLGKQVDTAGSKPLLVNSIVWQAVHFGGWMLIAAGIVPFNWWSLCFQQATWAVAVALFSLANTRLLMATVPVMGRSHFFAIHSVVTSLVSGFAPFLWGLLVDGSKEWHFWLGPVHLHTFSLVYLLVVLVVLSSLFLLSKIEEPKAMPADDFFNEFFIRTPVRAFSRIFVKRWMP